MDSQYIGKIGENIACGYLEGKGYKILSRNYRLKFGEIDIVSKSPDKTLVFVEVKTLTYSQNETEYSYTSYPHFSGNYSGKDPAVRITPEDHFTPKKVHSLIKACSWYANKFPDLSKSGFRIDLVAILLDPLSKKAVSLKHYESAVEE